MQQKGCGLPEKGPAAEAASQASSEEARGLTRRLPGRAYERRPTGAHLLAAAGWAISKHQPVPSLGFLTCKRGLR